MPTTTTTTTTSTRPTTTTTTTTTSTRRTTTDIAKPVERIETTATEEPVKVNETTTTMARETTPASTTTTGTQKNPTPKPTSPDVNSDGRIDVIDATIIIQYSAYIGANNYVDIGEFLAMKELVASE